jgi:lincosamide nucleotidyltransferase A/C/D/E
MNSAQVLQVLDRLDADSVTVWLDGGWGVDALLGEQTRPHEDLDLAIARGDCPRAQEALAALGFQHAPEVEPGLPARLVLRAPDGRHVDLHPLVLDADGNGLQELPDGGWGLYPTDGLRGHLPFWDDPEQVAQAILETTARATETTRPPGSSRDARAL